MKVSISACMVASALLTDVGVVRAQDEPTTRPADRQRQGPSRDRLMEMRPNNGSQRQEPANEQEWADISTFYKENMPNRWGMFEEAQSQRGPNAKVVESIKQRLTQRYRAIQRMRDNQARPDAPLPELYEMAVKQAKREDEAWGAVREYRASPNDSAKRDAMRDKVKAFVRGILDEKQARLTQMRNNLEDEEDRLSKDRENEEAMIDRQMEILMSDRPVIDLGGGRMQPGPGSPKGDNRPPRQPRAEQQSDAPSDKK